MKKKKILITGVCGMIGSHLLDELLCMGHQVVGCDSLLYGSKENIKSAFKNPNFQFFKADILDLAAMKRISRDCDVILHMAAVKKIGESDPAFATLHVNAMGTQIVLQAAKANGCKVVLGSTSDVYGRLNKIPFSESDDCVIGASTAKRWAYATSKMYAEHIALCYHKDHGVPVVVLRFFGCFSERSSKTWSGGHIPVFIHKIFQGLPIDIHGDGSQTRSMAHVSDIVRGTIAAMNASKAVGQIINLGNDEEISVLQSAKMIHRLLGKKTRLNLKFIPMKQIFGDYKEIARRVPDLSKAKKILGYKPQVSFEQALKLAIKAYGIH